MNRKERILKFGSPLFNIKNVALGVGGQDVADFEQISSARKYLPFNFLQVTNNGEDEITIYFDGSTSESKVIPSGTIMTFENIWFRRIVYKNTGSTNISANKIEFTAQVLPMSDEIARTRGIPIIQKIKLLFGV